MPKKLPHRSAAKKRKSTRTKSRKGNPSLSLEMPKILPVEIIDVDEDGQLICWPTKLTKDQQHAFEPPLQIMLTSENAKLFRPAPGIRERFLVRIEPVSKNSYTAKIIRKIGEGPDRILAVFREMPKGLIAEPVERSGKNSFFVDKQDRGEAKDGELVWVEKRNERNQRSGRSGGNKKARILEVAGNIDAPGAYSLIALASHNIRIEFPDQVIEDALNVTMPTMDGRVDLRDAGLLTIDPHDAKDHDDAVSAQPDPSPDNEGGYRVWVAIADVSWFVRPGSNLDDEAFKRGNSVYLPDRVIPMLPEELSNNLCSLRDREDRPCLAVEMVLDKNGQMIGHKFVRAMMRSAAKLSYEAAQDIFEGGKAPSKTIKQTMDALYAAYQCRLIERKKRAPLDLELQERKIILGKDGLVEQVALRERFDAHKLIEEFMILANVAAAQTLEKANTPLIYRVHDVPDPEKLQAIRAYLQTLDYTLVKGKSVRPSHFNQMLKIAAGRDQKEMVSEVVLRSQRQAIYSTQNLGHFGLNLNRYAHFTSPIRRYADLTVHRALVKACNLGEGGSTGNETERLSEIAENISTLERRAMLAERETNDRYLADYLSDQTGAEFDARIRGVTRFGLFVMLNETGADGFIPMRSLPGRSWQYDEPLNRIIDRNRREYYFLGQSVRVALKEATPVSGGLIFEIMTKPIKDKNDSSSRANSKTKNDKSKGGKAKTSKSHQQKMKKLKKSRKRKGR